MKNDTPAVGTVDPARSALMARVRTKGTKPEMAVGSALRRLGIGYRKNVKGLPGRPDFANVSRAWAVFVNGCYWHHHACPKGTIPTNNREFWKAKFRANRSRDARDIRKLRSMGFTVLLIWECDTSNENALLAKLSRALLPTAD